MKRRTLLGGTIAAAVIGATSGALAQQAPIKIGMSMAQTGGLAGGGKASLLGIEIWRDDVNARVACSAARSNSSSMTTSRALRKRRRSIRSFWTSTRSTSCSRPTLPCRRRR